MFLGAEYAEGCVVSDTRTRRRVETLDLRVRTRALKAQRWDVALALRGGRRLRRDVLAHQAEHADGTPFTLPMPQDLKAIGVSALATGVLNVRAGAAVGATTVNASVAGGGKRLWKGQFVAFSNHRKVYRVLSEDGLYAGASTAIDVYPALVAEVTTADKLELEPDLWAVYADALGFGVQDTAEGTAHTAMLGLVEYLE